VKTGRQHEQTFVHEAMATTFGVTIARGDVTYARQAATAAFAELDRVERLLSRYVEGSDIFRINRLTAGGAIVVQLDTFECLRVALDVQQGTEGAFDVAYGSAGPRPSAPRFELDAGEHSVRVLFDGIRIDLGGIGKGFALDRMAAVMGDWGLESALLCASTSTILALEPPLGEPGWPISFGPDQDLRHINLVHRAFSASGKSVHGDHIIDPHAGRPAGGWQRCWSAAPTGAVADALSTAFMVIGEDAIRAYCSHHANVSAWGEKRDGSVFEIRS
jgi:thiamine biosynthesis lipoprotein